VLGPLPRRKERCSTKPAHQKFAGSGSRTPRRKTFSAKRVHSRYLKTSQSHQKGGRTRDRRSKRGENGGREGEGPGRSRQQKEAIWLVTQRVGGSARANSKFRAVPSARRLETFLCFGGGKTLTVENMTKTARSRSPGYRKRNQRSPRAWKRIGDEARFSTSRTSTEGGASQRQAISRGAVFPRPNKKKHGARGRSIHSSEATIGKREGVTTRL